MHRDSSAECDHVTGGSQRGFTVGLLACVRGLARIGVAASLLTCLAAAESEPSTQPVPQKLTVHRSMRAVPRKYAIHPNGAIIGANQAQRFDVTDADGNPVAVRWNVSGVGCSGANCGTIDAQGVYRTPPALPKPGVVVLEGVLVSDPRHSVLTEIRLEASASSNVNASPVEASGPRPKPLDAPVLQGQSMPRRSEAPPLPHAVAATPVVRDVKSLRRVEFPASPSVVAAAPGVERWRSDRKVPTPPPPGIVAAPPVVRDLNNASRVAILPSQQAVAAAPSLGKLGITRKTQPLPAQSPVAAPPALKGITSSPRLETSITPQVVAASPSVERLYVARSSQSLPAQSPVAAPPALKGMTSSPRLENSITPRVVAASPSVEKLDIARSSQSLPAQTPVAAPPALKGMTSSPRLETSITPQVVAASPSVEKLYVARSSQSLPAQTPVAAPPALKGITSSPRLETSIAPQVVAAAPQVEKLNMARTLEPPLSVVGLPTAHSAVQARQTIAASAPLQPLPAEPGMLAGETSSMAAPTPTVTYQNGQLTIRADGATLADVLTQVAAKTGATIEVPPGSGLEHIVEHSGPGRPNEILTQLLNGSQFNFIIVASPQHPDSPTQVLLSLQRSDTETPATVAAAPAAQTSPLWTPPPPSTEPQPLPPQYDSSLAPPKDKDELSPEARGELMKAKMRELIEKSQQQTPAQ